jgi:gamma-glutamyltranspeptidase
MSFGVMGGDFQPQGHVQILMNMIDFGMNLQEAGDSPRFEHIGSSSVTGELALGQGEILMESGFDFEEIRKLMNKGHKVGFRLLWRISSYNVCNKKKCTLVHLNRARRTSVRILKTDVFQEIF